MQAVRAIAALVVLTVAAERAQAAMSETDYRAFRELARAAAGLAAQIEGCGVDTEEIPRAFKQVLDLCEATASQTAEIVGEFRREKRHLQSTQSHTCYAGRENAQKNLEALRESFMKTIRSGRCHMNLSRPAPGLGQSHATYAPHQTPHQNRRLL